MSFILDALRKAETKNRDRHSLTVPTGPRVLTEELPETPSGSRSLLWLVIPVAVVLGLAWWVLFARDSAAPATRTTAPATNPPAQAVAGNRPAPVVQSPEQTTPVQRTNVPRETGARALDREARRGAAGNEPRAQSGTAANTTAPQSTPGRITPGTVRIIQPDGSVSADTMGSDAIDSGTGDQSNQSLPAAGRVETETLPEYQSSLASGDVPIPELHLDMHVFSAQPEKRFVFINLEKYQEGSAIDRDTVVESIEPEGAVINYKGYRFVLRPE